jgi:hypothetical protein
MRFDNRVSNKQARRADRQINKGSLDRLRRKNNMYDLELPDDVSPQVFAGTQLRTRATVEAQQETKRDPVALSAGEVLEMISPEFNPLNKFKR